MNNRQKKKHNNMSTTPHTIYEQTANNGILAEELLYKPVTYDIKSDRGSDFDHLMVPFKVQGEKLFFIQFMDSCTLSVYLKYLPLNEGLLSGYCDISMDMKECLEIQETMGVEYYFGRLNKTYNYYMYALNIFLNKGLIDDEKFLELIRNVGFDENCISQAVDSIEKQRMQNKDTSNVITAGDILRDLFKNIGDDNGRILQIFRQPKKVR